MVSPPTQAQTRDVVSSLHSQVSPVNDAMLPVMSTGENEMLPEPIAPRILDFNNPDADVFESSRNASANVVEPGIEERWRRVEEGLFSVVNNPLGVRLPVLPPPEESRLPAQQPAESSASQGARNQRARGKELKNLRNQSKCPHLIP
jgi:hypothetical protein